MQFGIQFFPDVGPQHKPADQYFREALALVDQAEPLGYSHVRIVEHHFHYYGGYSPNPCVFLAAAAARTNRMRLVTGAVLPAFNNPLKLAGEIGMLDAISGGRLDVGFARAFLPHEFRRFGVSPRTIYNTLNRAQGPRKARTRTVSLRVSERELAGFMAALATRGITDRPAVLRRLMGATDQILKPADQATNDKLAGWNADIQTRGAAINQIAHKLNEAKLQGRQMPYTEEDDATIRTMAMFLFAFVEEFEGLWGAKREAMALEVDRALEGLEAMPGTFVTSGSRTMTRK